MEKGKAYVLNVEDPGYVSTISFLGVVKNAPLIGYVNMEESDGRVLIAMAMEYVSIRD